MQLVMKVRTLPSTTTMLSFDDDNDDDDDDDDDDHDHDDDDDDNDDDDDDADVDDDVDDHDHDHDHDVDDGYDGYDDEYKGKNLYVNRLEAVGSTIIRRNGFRFLVPYHVHYNSNRYSASSS